MSEKIVVIGASLIDTKGKPLAGLDTGTSNPAKIHRTLGGTARNVAENLARLGSNVMLVSAVGDDFAGREIIEHTAAAGVDCTHVQMVAGASTGGYMAVLHGEGQLSVALEDTRVMTAVTSEYLIQNKTRFFEDVDMVVLDGGVTGATLNTALDLADAAGIPVCVDPSSTRLAGRLYPFISRLSLVVPNELEAAALFDVEQTGYDPEASMNLARRMVQEGVKTAVVSLSDFGLVYATEEESGYLPAHFVEMMDSTGTGDAITAAIIFGMQNEFPILESARLGAAAASLTLQTQETVYPGLSLDLLYEHLIV